MKKVISIVSVIFMTSCAPTVKLIGYCSVPGITNPMVLPTVTLEGERVWAEVDGRKVSFPAAFCLLEVAKEDAKN